MTVVVNMIVLGEADNVGIALRDIAADGAAVDVCGRTVAAHERVPQGHKIALASITAGEPIIRYGVPVGVAIAAIPQGSLAHIHNIRSQYLDNDEDHYE